MAGTFPGWSNSVKVLSSTRFGDSSGFSRLSLCFTDKGGKGEASQRKVPTDSNLTASQQ